MGLVKEKEGWSGGGVRASVFKIYDRLIFPLDFTPVRGMSAVFPSLIFRAVRRGDEWAWELGSEKGKMEEQ